MLLADVLRWVVILSCTAPFVVAALRLQQPRQRAGWWVAAVLAACISWTADPIAVALRRVDGILMAPLCSV
ncbi:MAG: hypothetical protein LBQ32_13215 [Burkholderiaceae bacterium]|nr:hypothetical protein [Burkholderiaceae bacterium]